MKPARSEYFAPESVDEALSLLAKHGYDAKVLAGGQSLMPKEYRKEVGAVVAVGVSARGVGLGETDSVQAATNNNVRTATLVINARPFPNVFIQRPCHAGYANS